MTTDTNSTQIPQDPNAVRFAYGFLIDPATKTVTPVRLDADDHTEITRLLLVDWFDVVRLSPPHPRTGEHVCMYLDDEGRIAYPNPHGYFRLLNESGEPGDYYCGRGLILGGNAEGFTVTAPVALRQVVERIQWCDTPDESEVEPVITVTSF